MLLVATNLTLYIIFEYMYISFKVSGSFQSVSSSLFNLFIYTYFARVMTLHKFHIIRKFISKFKQLQAYKTCPTGLPRLQFVPSAYKWKIIALACGKWKMGNKVVLVEVEVEVEVVSIILASLSRHTCYRSCFLSLLTSLSPSFLTLLRCSPKQARCICERWLPCLAIKRTFYGTIPPASAEVVIEYATTTTTASWLQFKEKTSSISATTFEMP